MGKASRRRRRQKKRRDRKRKRDRKRERERGARAQTQALARIKGGLHVQLCVQQLEMARGYDGLLRGMPEPTLLLGVYRIDNDHHARALGRYLYRFERPREFPTKVAPKQASRESLVFVPADGTRLLVLALAVEEDSGKGLQILFADLEDGDSVVAWTDHEAAPVPTHLPELTEDRLPPDLGHRIHLMFGDRDPSKRLEGDDWIDANLLWTSLSSKQVAHRMHFVSTDGRNDWTAQIELSLRRS